MNRYKKQILLVLICVSLAGMLLWIKNVEYQKQQALALEQIEQENKQKALTALQEEGQKTVDELLPKLGGFPSTLEEKELDAAVKQAHTFIDTYKTYIAENEDDAVLAWQVCELYRQLYNTDEPNSFENTEKYCEKSIQLNSEDARPYISQAMLYVNANIALADDAAQLFLKAQERAKDDYEKIAVYQGLAFAYYYQGKVDELEILLEKWNEEYPTNTQLDLFKNVLKKK
jgi:hypothetical protein